MKRQLRRYLLGINTIDAWHRDKILDAAERIFLERRKKIIINTVIVLTIINIGVHYLFSLL